MTVFHSEIRRYSGTRVHPLLNGWLNRLEPCRTDLAGLQGCWAKLDCDRAEMFAFPRRYDVILAPAYMPALPHGAPDRDERFRGFSDTTTYNVAGQPVAVVRCGELAERLPIPVQVVAASWREDVALAAAAGLNQEFGSWRAPTTL